MSILSKECDGLGYYYGFRDGDGRQINVRYENADLWQAYVGDNKVPPPAGLPGWPNRGVAEEAAIEWATANAETETVSN